MRKYQTIALIILSLAVLALSYYQINNRKAVVYINSAKLMNEYKGMIKARAEYKVKADAWQGEIDTLYARLEIMIKEFEKKSPDLSSAEKKSQLAFIEKKKADAEKHRNVLEEKARLEDKTMTSAVINEVNTFINEYSKKKRYKIIIGATEYGNLIYARENLDITDEVIIAINRDYKE